MDKTIIYTRELLKTNPLLFLEVYKQLEKSYILKFKYYPFLKENKNINNELLKEIFYRIFDNKYSVEEYLTRVTYTNKKHKKNFNEYAEMDDEKNGLDSCSIKLNCLDSAFSLSSHIHEFAHARIFTNEESEDNFSEELVARLTEIISVAMLDEILGTKYIEGEYIENLLELKAERAAYFYHLKEFSYHKNNQEFFLDSALIDLEYSLTRIYAIRLLEIYKENKKEILKAIKEMLSNNLSVDSFLKTYEITADKRITVNSTIKLIKKYGIKM